MRRAQGRLEELGRNHFKLYVTVGVNPETGNQRRKTKTVRCSRAQAEKQLAILIARYSEGGEPIEDDLTLDEYWRFVYLPNAKARIRPNTLQGYMNNYKRLICDHLGGIALSKINAGMIESWLAGFSNIKVRIVAYRHLRLFLNRAVKDKYLAFNPIHQVDEPKLKKLYRPEVLKRDVAAEYLKLCRGAKIEPVVLLAIGGGFRRSEIAALDWKDIGEDGAVDVDNAMTVAFGQRYEEDTKTPFSERVVHLPKAISRRLNELRGSGPLFTWRGRRVVPDTITRYYKDWQDGLPDDVPRISLKNLRHTSLTLTLESGVDLLSVSRRAGHSTTAITARYYIRPSDSLDVEAAKKLDGFLETA